MLMVMLVTSTSDEEYIGIAGHLDVVPADSGWDYPAYAAKIVDEDLHRGALDDKGHI